METIYIKRFIKTEADLPKEAGSYFVKLKRGDARLLYFPFDGDVGYNIFKTDWMKDVEFWLQPTTLAELIKEKLPSEEQYKKDCPQELKPRIAAWIQGVKYVINKLTEL